MADNPSGARGRTGTSEAEAAEGVGATGAVVAGIDGSEADGPVTDWAADEADGLGVPLRLVNAIDPGVQMTAYEVLASGSWWSLRWGRNTRSLHGGHPVAAGEEETGLRTTASSA